MWEKTKERIAVAQVFQYLVNSLVDVRWLNGRQARLPSCGSKEWVLGGRNGIDRCNRMGNSHFIDWDELARVKLFCWSRGPCCNN